MLHARDDYNRIQDPLGKIPVEEPVFLLRGQDRMAPVALRAYADAVENHGGDTKIILKARAWADRMDAWQQHRASKMPDL